MPKLRLALVGAGRWGKRILATLEGIPGVRVACVCARSAKSLAEIPAQYEKIRSLRALLARDDLDGVIVATPAATHAEVALPFLRRGIPVFIEKPMTTAPRDAEKLLRAARAAKTWIFAGHLHLYNPAFLAAKKAAAACGKIRFVLCEGVSSGPRRDDVSVLWDWGSHDTYMVVDLLGMPRTVQSWGRDDFSVMRLRCAGNVEACCVNSWLSPEKHKRVTIVCDRGTVVFDDVLEEKKVTVLQGGAVRHPPYDAVRPLEAELRAFVRCLAGKTVPLAGGQDGAAVVRILAAADRSKKRGGDAIALPRTGRVR